MERFKSYLYVILDTNGASWVVTEQSTRKVALTRLLDDGWQPIRETPFSGTDTMSPYVLVLLGRDTPPRRDPLDEP